MDASTLVSQLHDLVNHSARDEELKHYLRNELYKYETYNNNNVKSEDKFLFKDLINNSSYNENLKKKLYSKIDNYENKDKPHFITITFKGLERPATKYNIFIKNGMKALKLENPNMTAIELMIIAASKWKEEEIKTKHHKEKFLKEIIDHKINKDMCKITDLVIGNITGSNFKR